MPDTTATPLQVFISFASEDDALREELVKHFAQLERDGLIESWHGRQIGAGENWAGQIDASLEAADIVLLLVSPAFLHSRYCYDVEMKRALERHAAGQARVIPVILRPADWQTAPFAKLQAFPSYAKPVVSWPSRDEAFVDVAKGLRRTVAEIRAAASAGVTRSPPSLPLPTPASASLLETVALPGSQEATLPTPDLPPQKGGSLLGLKFQRPWALAFMLIPTVLLGIAAVALSIWRVPTKLTFDLVVDRVAFTMGGAKPIDLPDRPLDFQALTVEDFDQASVGATLLEGTDGERSELTITPAQPGAASAGRLESMTVESGAKVILEASRAEGPTLTARVYGKGFQSRVLPAGQIEVRATNATVKEAADANGSSTPMVLRPTTPPEAPYVQFAGARRAFAIIVTPQQPDDEPFVQRLPITEVAFDKEGAGATRTSSIVEKSRAAYVETPSADPIDLNPGDVLAVGDLRDASLTRLRLSREGRLQLGLEGVFGTVDTRTSGAGEQDRRETAVRWLWHTSREVVLLVVLVWAACVLMGAYMLRRHVAGQT